MSDDDHDPIQDNLEPTIHRALNEARDLMAFGPFLDRAETEVHSADEAGATLAHARVLRAVEAVEAEYVANPRAFDPRVLA